MKLEQTAVERYVQFELHNGPGLLLLGFDLAIGDPFEIFAVRFAQRTAKPLGLFEAEVFPVGGNAFLQTVRSLGLRAEVNSAADELDHRMLANQPVELVQGVFV